MMRLITTMRCHRPIIAQGLRSNIGFVWAMVLGLVLLSHTNTTQASSLEGQVLDVEGNPVQDVSVFIYTGKPKKSPAVLCPYCYVDCGKQTKTDLDGAFTFESVDDALTFKLLLVKDGYSSAFSDSLDPLGPAATLKIQALNMEDVPDSRLLKGSVIDPEGEPVVGATVDVEGYSSNSRGTTWGPASKVMVTPMAVTDSKGRFILIAKEEVQKLNLDVNARGFAVKEFYDAPIGGKAVVYQLEEGGSVTGRLLHEGKPLAGKIMTISSKDRSTRSNFNRQIIATDKDGRFTFLNLPSGLSYHLTAKPDSVSDLGMVPVTTVRQLKNTHMEDVGDLSVQEGLEIEGQIKVAGGGEVPKDTILFVSHEQIWENPQISIPPDGKFHVKNLQPGEYRLSLRAKGYIFSHRNLSYQGINGGQLEATIRESVTGLILEIEEGEQDWNQSGFVQGWPSHEWARALPLRGVEPVAEDDLAARIKIQAKDQGTGKKITSFEITPGWAFPPRNRPIWNTIRSIQSDGTQWIELLDRSGAAMVRVSHPDYLEETLNVQNAFDETLEVSLRKGQTLSGKILSPTGNPIKGAHIAHVLPVKWPHEMPTLHYREIKFLTNRPGNHIFIESGDSGRFVVPASKHPFDLMVLHDDGFYAKQGIKPNDDFEIRLQPWGRIEGTIPGFKTSSNYYIQLNANRPRLKGESQPAKGLLDAAKDAISKLIHGKSAAQMKKNPFRLQFSNNNTIEENGKFSISNVPPGVWWVVLNERKVIEQQGIPSGAFTSQPLEALEVKVLPGKQVIIQLPNPSK